MNKRQLKKKYKKNYNLDFIRNKVAETFNQHFMSIKVAFYDVKNKNIGIILDNRNHGYYDILEDNLVF